jgi:hypothetical protein
LLKFSFDYTRNETKHRSIVDEKTQNTFYGMDDVTTFVFDIGAGGNVFS